VNDATQLTAVAAQPWLRRLPVYLRLSGPGWLQGAMTLGGGSAITSLTIGGVYGYELLWVQPLSMLVGCIMLFALSHQTLSTGEAPFRAMRDHVHPSLAWAWAIAALASSIIWGFSHYPLSAGMLEEIVEVASGFSLKESGGIGRELYLLALAIGVWAVCAYTAWNYGSGGRAVALFENGIKLLSGMIILAFAWVVLSAGLQGKIEWGQVLAGYVPRSLPGDAAGVTTIMAALGTAVGINMTFVYGYTLLHRGWGREHRELSRYDIVMGLVIPYMLVTGLISIAAAGAFYGSDLDLAGKLSPARASSLFAEVGLGDVTGKLVFTLGVLGMAAGSLVMHMLCCGAAAAEMFGWSHDSRRYRLALLLPTPAVLGVFVWSTMGAYVVLPTSAICGLLLPIAYVGWLVLNNRPDYLGDDCPRGGRAALFNTAMALCILVVLASVSYSTLVGLGWW
jgi:Mn2+/Fe2+ NRAMP family transporter